MKGVSNVHDPASEIRAERSRYQSSRKRASVSAGSLAHPTFMTLMDRFGTDDEGRMVLEELRWPQGPVCARCQSSKLSRMYKRDQFDCDACGYQFSVMAG